MGPQYVRLGTIGAALLVALSLFSAFAETTTIHGKATRVSFDRPVPRGGFWKEIEGTDSFDFWVTTPDMYLDSPVNITFNLKAMDGGDPDWIRYEPKSNILNYCGDVAHLRMWVRIPTDTPPGNYSFLLKGLIPIKDSTGQVALAFGPGIRISLEVGGLVWYRQPLTLALIGFTGISITLTLPFVVHRRRKKRQIERIQTMVGEVEKIEGLVQGVIEAQDVTQEALKGIIEPSKGRLSRLSRHLPLISRLNRRDED